MDREGLKRFLKRKGKKSHVIEKFYRELDNYEAYLRDLRGGIGIEQSTVEDLEVYVKWYEKSTKKEANSVLWALLGIFDFMSRDDLYERAGSLREDRTKKTRVIFKLRDYVGINQDFVNQLAKIRIKNVDDMIEAGKTRDLREKLAEKTGIPKEEILKYVKFANLSRLGAVKKIRSPLYYEAGFDTLDKIANTPSKEFISKIQDFINATDYDAIAPLPKEAANTVKTAKKLPRLIEW